MNTGEPASSSATVVAWVLSRRPKGISAWIQSEFVHTITEAIDDLRGEFHVHLNVLIGKDKSLLSSVDVPVVGILHVLNCECECVILREMESHIFKAVSWVSLPHIKHVRRDSEARRIHISNKHSDEAIAWRINQILEVVDDLVILSKEVHVPPVNSLSLDSIFQA
jgi:hypothetical protein